MAPEEIRRRWEKRDKSGEKGNTWSSLSIWIYGKHHSETHLFVLWNLSPPIFKGVFITSLTTVNLREGDSLRPTWPGRQGGRIQSCWSQISVAKKQNEQEAGLAAFLELTSSNKVPSSQRLPSLPKEEARLSNYNKSHQSPCWLPTRFHLLKVSAPQNCNLEYQAANR